MVSRNTRTQVTESATRNTPKRLAIGRVRLRSLARVGFSIGWIVSLLPALLTSILLAWVLHGIWTTLDGWAPWNPWPADTRILGVALPTPPEFRPREALRVDGFYRRLAPLGAHPVIAATLGTVVLTVLGGLLVTAIMTLAGLAYNLFARLTGGIEFELVERAGSRSSPARTGRRAQQADDDLDEANLRW